MKIQDFLDPGELQPIVIDGAPVEGALCKLAPLDDLMQLFLDGVHKNTIKFGASLLAMCVVNPDGTPVADVKGWCRVPFKNRERFEALVSEVSKICGVMQAEQAAELGKPSEATGASDSNSTSASG